MPTKTASRRHWRPRLSPARSAGATFQVRHLMAVGGWPPAGGHDATSSAHSWRPSSCGKGSDPGDVLVLEIAQALPSEAIRSRPSCFAAVDTGDVQAPAKVGRERRAGPHLSGIDTRLRWQTTGPRSRSTRHAARDTIAALVA